MTIGEKIAKIRKDNKLSQEEFGELFLVSRQAVGKWESDSVLPETDKIIRMCSGFDVSINWLLGIEEDEYNADKDLETFEIISKVNSTYDEKIYNINRKSKKWFKFVTTFTIVLALVMSVAFMILFERYQELDSRLDWINSDTAGNNTVWDKQINDLTQKTDGFMKEHYYKLGVYEYSVEYIDFSDETVEMDFRVVPIVFNNTTTAKIEVMDLETYEVSAIDLSKNLDDSFSGKIKVPFCDTVQIRVALTTDGISNYEVIVNEYDVKEKVTPKIKLLWFGGKTVSESQMKEVEFIFNFINRDYENNFAINDLSIYYMYNGELVEESDYPENYVYEMEYLSTNQWKIVMPELNFADKIYSHYYVYEMYAKYTDDNGNEYDQYLADYDYFNQNWYYGNENS